MSAAALHVAEVVGDDDEVERLAVDAGRCQRLARRFECDVRGHRARSDVTAFLDSGDRLELLHDLGVCFG